VANRSVRMFLLIVLSIWALMHTYVFWRLFSINWIHAHVRSWWVIGAAALLWISYPLARWLGHTRLHSAGHYLEFFSSNWMGVLFLLFSIFLIADALTLGGFLFHNRVSHIRTGAAILALGLSLIALIQGLRPPVIRNYNIRVPNLPAQRDPLTLVAISDTHLGTMISPAWMRKVIQQIEALHPDVVCIVGDLLDSHAEKNPVLIPVLQTLRAPLGVYAVTGNHEYYVGLDHSLETLRQAGYRVLQDEWLEATPGLIIAGVNDLTARRQFGKKEESPIPTALANRPPGATILLTHSPWQAETAAKLGVNLMLSGHTHNGQIWPFNYLVHLMYPRIAGEYQVGELKVIVGRGTGTWGPRMRLWQASEIICIRLHRVPEESTRIRDRNS